MLGHRMRTSRSSMTVAPVRSSISRRLVGMPLPGSRTRAASISPGLFPMKGSTITDCESAALTEAVDMTVNLLKTGKPDPPPTRQIATSRTNWTSAPSAKSRSCLLGAHQTSPSWARNPAASAPRAPTGVSTPSAEPSTSPKESRCTPRHWPW